MLFRKKMLTVCVDKTYETGNLIYNSDFRNTAEEFLSDAEHIPANPDGYTGECRVVEEDSNKVLLTDGITQYLHYGVSYGEILYSVAIKGEGTVSFYAIRNNDSVKLDNNELDFLGGLKISSDSYPTNDMLLSIEDSPENEFEQVGMAWGIRLWG